MRYSSSMLVAVIISFITFFGMSLLIVTPKYQKPTSIAMVDFTKINDMPAPDVAKPEPTHEKPIEPTIKHPPAAPKIDITSNPTRGELAIPTGRAKIADAFISKFAKPDVLGVGNVGGPGNSQGLIQLVAIEPIYPPAAVKNKIEGWVQVEFTVTEFGKATKVKIVAANPKTIFNNATIRAIYKSKFKPLILDGKAVSQTAVQTIEFKLRD